MLLWVDEFVIDFPLMEFVIREVIGGMRLDYRWPIKLGCFELYVIYGISS